MARTAVKKSSVKKSVQKKGSKRKSTTTKRTTKKETPAQIIELLKRAEQQQKEEKRTRKRAKASEEIRTPVQEVPTIERGQSFERTYSIEFKPFVREKEGQVTLSELRKLSFTDRKELWRRLNTDETTFFGIVIPSEVHITRHMTKAEAVARGLITEKKPHKEALYCPYCHDWNLFRRWNDYHKCTGCGISTNDFYTRTENNLWNAK